MEPNEITIPSSWDLNYFVVAVGFTYPYATIHNETTTTTIRFNGRDYDKVTAAYDAYPTSYLPNLQKKARLKVAEIGREQASSFPFMGSRFPLDFTTECRLDGLCRYFDRNETATEIHWDATGEGDFQTISREMGYALFDAASQHMQAVFNKRKELTDLINAAVDINDAVFDKLELGWPGQAATVEETTPPV